MLFFNDVSSHIQITNRSKTFETNARPMLRAIYVPAGMPMWTRFSSEHQFSHLDLHLHRDWLLRRLAPILGRSMAQTTIRTYVELQDVQSLEAIAQTLVGEISNPARHTLFAESLATTLAVGLLDLPPETQEPVSGGLTPAQMNHLQTLVAASNRNKISIATLSSEIGLSESWFCHAFKKTNGVTPLQWVQEQRLDQVKELLDTSTITIAGAAAAVGFSDQAHLTRVFRQFEGTTPAVWRRANRQK